ncbi:MAG: hypothetical protein QW607_01625 [Desulfurococcaceae archaeon]
MTNKNIITNCKGVNAGRKSNCKGVNAGRKSTSCKDINTIDKIISDNEIINRIDGISGIGDLLLDSSSMT